MKTKSSPFPDDGILLPILNKIQPDRPWRSSREKRQCIACERVFRGDDATVEESEDGEIALSCPSCGSAPQLWVRLGDPLTDADIWADWESAIASSMAAVLDGGK